MKIEAVRDAGTSSSLATVDAELARGAKRTADAPLDDAGNPNRLASLGRSLCCLGGGPYDMTSFGIDGVSEILRKKLLTRADLHGVMLVLFVTCSLDGIGTTRSRLRKQHSRNGKIGSRNSSSRVQRTACSHN